jgi:hypothetical protein
VFDPDDPPPAVDVCDLQARHLRSPQAGGVGHRQRHAVTKAADRAQKAHDLVGAQDDRQPPAPTRIGDALGQIRPAHRHAEEEPQGAHRLVQGAPGHRLPHQMHLVRPHILDIRRAQRPTEMPAELGDVMQV